MGKNFTRGMLLEKYYPVLNKRPKIKKIDNNIDKDLLKNIEELLIINNNTIVVTGIFAYNLMCKFANIKNYNEEIINYYELLSFDIENDLNKIVNYLKSINNNIKVEKYREFQQYLSYRYIIYINNTKIIELFNLSDECIEINNYEEKNICSFFYLLRYFYSIAFINRCEKNKILKNIIIV